MIIFPNNVFFLKEGMCFIPCSSALSPLLHAEYCFIPMVHTRPVVGVGSGLTVGNVVVTIVGNDVDLTVTAADGYNFDQIFFYVGLGEEVVYKNVTPVLLDPLVFRFTTLVCRLKVAMFSSAFFKLGI
jgi:hypothetical protein